MKEISILSNSRHLEWRGGSVGHNFEKAPPKNHPRSNLSNLDQEKI